MGARKCIDLHHRQSRARADAVPREVTRAVGVGVGWIGHLVSLAFALSLQGCTSDTSGSETGAEDGTGCGECVGSQQGPIGCECQIAVNNWEYIGVDACIPGTADPAGWCTNKCQDKYGGSIAGRSAEAVCQESGSPSCTGWSPSSNVSYVGGVYRVNATWFATVVANTDPLWACDDATLAPLSSGSGFEVQGASSGEFLYLIGLRNGDRPQSLNGKPLSSFADGYKAFELYLEGVTSYSLTVKRGTSTITLSLSLV